MNARAERVLGCDGVQVAPSVLAADFGRLAEHCRAAEEAGADLLHLDVMDGHFVPNITIGPDIVSAVRKAVDLPLDCHLMISEPLTYLERFVEAGADIVCFHAESEGDTVETARRIRGLGAAAALTLNPETPFERAAPYLPDVDLALVMTVHPGFGGQSFLREPLEKVRRIRSEFGLPVAVDGGVGPAVAGLCVEAGARILVAGTAVFRQPDMAGAVRAIRGA